MAIPRVFVSSTCYDLKYVRENLKYFIRTIGYEPVLSDDGDVYYDPSSHTHDACLREVENCQLFVLIIGGRYGGKYKDGNSSITNNEYKQAIKSNIPVFALVERNVYSDHHLFITNRKEDPVICEKIKYPNCDNTKIFEFLDEVRKNSTNNSLFPFADFSDIESYLKKQWAGMMFEFLDQRQQDCNAKITNRLLDDLTLATRKSEELIKILVKASQPIVDAEAAIQKVDNKVKAENFARLVLSKFTMTKLLKTSIDDLQKIPMDGSWIDFLLSTRDFYQDKLCLDEDSGEIDTVLFGNSGRGIAVAFETIEEGRTFNSFPDFEKAFNALKISEPDTRMAVFKMLVNGLE